MWHIVGATELPLNLNVATVRSSESLGGAVAFFVGTKNDLNKIKSSLRYQVHDVCWFQSDQSTHRQYAIH